MYVIAIVGAGGKTSRIKNLTREYVQQGKKVLVTTTTHMGLEPGMVLSENLEDIRQQLEKQNVCICGSPVKEGKIASLPKDIYDHAVGHPFYEVSHRLELVKQCLGVSDTDLVTEAHLEKLYLEGYQKPLQEKYPNAKIGFFPAEHSHFLIQNP